MKIFVAPSFFTLSIFCVAFSTLMLLVLTELEWEPELCSQLHGQEKSECEHSTARHFSNTYLQARQHFRNQVQRLNERAGAFASEQGAMTASADDLVTLTSHLVAYDAVLDLNLTMEFLVLKGRDHDEEGDREKVERGAKPAALLHVSGVHGVEGYLGSAIQSAVLEKLEFTTVEANKKNKKRVVRLDGPSVLMLHVVNPHGMMHYRRVNENNVDLNRNDVDISPESEFNSAKSKETRADMLRQLEEHSDLYGPTFGMSNPGSREENVGFTFGGILKQLLGTMTYHMVTRGRLAVAAPLAAGQYALPQRAMYGGTPFVQKEKSYVVVEEVLKPFMDKFHFMGSIDVHTGLGASGKDVLLTTGPDSWDTLATRQAFAMLKPRDSGRWDTPATVQCVNCADAEKLMAPIKAKHRLPFTHTSVAGMMNHTRYLTRSMSKGPESAPDSWLFRTWQEFGTKINIFVGACLLVDNAVYHMSAVDGVSPNGGGHSFLHEWAQRRCNVPSFYSRSLLWKGEALDRGLDAFFVGFRYIDDVVERQKAKGE